MLSQQLTDEFGKTGKIHHRKTSWLEGQQFCGGTSIKTCLQLPLSKKLKKENNLIKAFESWCSRPPKFIFTIPQPNIIQFGHVGFHMDFSCHLLWAMASNYPNVKGKLNFSWTMHLGERYTLYSFNGVYKTFEVRSTLDLADRNRWPSNILHVAMPSQPIDNVL